MKVRLTETELVSLIKKIMTEQKSLLNEGDGSEQNPYTDADLTGFVDTIVDDLDGFVDGDNLKSIYDILVSLRTKFAINDDDPTKPVTVSAIKRLSDLYTLDESGDTLLGDLTSVGTKTLSVASTKLKTQCIALLNAGLAEVVPQTPATPPAQGATELKSCASKEAGFIDKGTWWIIKPFGQGELRGFHDGHKNGNGNLFFVPNGSSSHTHVANGSCVSGVLDIGTWSAV